MAARLKNSRHDPRERTFYRFSICAGHYARFLAGMYRPKHHLSTSEWKVLAILGVQAPISATETGQRTSLEPDKVTRAVDSLVAKGLALRNEDKRDRRRVILTVSPKGARAFREIDRVRFRIESDMLALLSKSDRDALRAILGKIEQSTKDLLSRRRPRGAGIT